MQMKSNLIVLAAVISTLWAGPTLALDCGDWNSESFLAEASVSDVQSCLTSAQNPGALNYLGRTPLISAAFADRPDIIKFLLSSGANVA
ncbi:ankyrin repeat domain-containing protein [Sulfitobacter sp. M57]|uniref:ankyrin repeat domain-containing protein n=1 Tax=unclassified Sulfitobacter TaxID=196795 RepID=UPI0023E1E65D|nr:MULTISPECIES: ankyrin repeat domain-containing protein [unclassified Sulfitobacter]MDF3416637.1 ankyrin repeat domain-containing protein [Sulfitobacter sp. KE5]MDF3424117.1 ankyrin repeat domain-containing protein [Sulfitobacter sp. KE43]MDF3435182.1 ankyrin repeat domain-containing protein [Sulfitobacter sp. KE42]MDF3460814.1 ankyrin repeat domain-containing protein [Sulfitobacter sp. S74]MDF3464719.1 ankyrin repeat domain-containing protein [Sulfitobacter sp. Ks18]